MLPQNFIDMLSAFVAEKVDFLVVGSYAMSFHGWSRATGDIDFLIRPEESNAEAVLRALVRFEASLLGLEKKDLLTSGTVFQIGLPPQRIDIINLISGVDIEEAWEGREFVEIYGLNIPIIGKHQLIKNKKATGRPKDQIDVLWMESEPK